MFANGKEQSGKLLVYDRFSDSVYYGGLQTQVRKSSTVNYQRIMILIITAEFNLEKGGPSENGDLPGSL